ncbi:hypothetical protein D9M68_250420 [compost metagenome]
MSKSRYSLRFLVPGLVGTLLLSEAAFAQDSKRVEELEGRIDGLETKMDALIELMTKQQSDAKPADAAGGRQPQEQARTASVASADGLPLQLKPGLNLDLYSIELGDEWPQIPPGYPVASTVIKSSQPFNLDAFRDNPQLKQYARPSGKSLGQFLSGKILLDETGEYVFQANVSNNGNVNFGSTECFASAIVDGQAIASTALKLDDGKASANQATVSLEGGLHSVGIWALCNGYGHSKYIDVTLSVKAPRDRTPKLIDTSQFLVDE